MEGKPWFDASLAKKYLRMDAEAGNAAPQFNLGLLYYNGTFNTGSDPVSGLFWINKSAEQKFPYALDFLSKRENGWDK